MSISPIIHTLISTSGSLVVVSGTVVISILLEALFEEAISDLFFLECETATTTPMLTHKIRTRAIRAGR